MNNTPETHIQILQVEHLCSAPTLEAMPQEGIPEVAFVGRSNVGKSSLFNRITGRKNLAHTSSVPGKTQSFHSYEVTARVNGEDHLLHLIDLPGFGYAKFSKKKREYISRLTVEYMSSRDPLKGILLLNDIRRDPAEDELAIQALGFEYGIPVCIVATKADKVKRNDVKKRLKAIADKYHLQADDIIISGEKYQHDPVWQQILMLLG